MKFNIQQLTPIETHGGISFKREDKFAPNGYGGINGSKLRQCIHLIDKWHEQGYVGVVSGGVSESPQHAFISAVCKDYGMGCVIVTAKDDISKSKYLKIAQRNGAVFQKSKVGYAKSLNAQAKKLLERLPNHKLLEVNITLDSRFNNYEDIKAFHGLCVKS